VYPPGALFPPRGFKGGFPGNLPNFPPLGGPFKPRLNPVDPPTKTGPPKEGYTENTLGKGPTPKGNPISHPPV